MKHNHPKIEIMDTSSATVNRPAESPLCPMRSLMIARFVTGGIEGRPGGGGFCAGIRRRV